MSEHETPAPADLPAHGHCENCGTPLLGEHCYACGQPVKGLVRHFSTILGDIADTVFNYDSRLPRSLWPLFVRPGWLTLEYFAGHRVRYVSPVRLFITLSIVTFFVAQLALSFGNNPSLIADDDVVNFAQARTVAEVIQQRDDALAKVEGSRKQGDTTVPGMALGMDIAEKAIRNGADARIAHLQRKAADGKAATEPAAKTSAATPATADSPTPAADADDDPTSDIAFNGTPWDPQTNPLTVPWWPAFANHWLNAQVGRAKTNIKRMQADQDLFKDAFLGAVPSTLFVLLPVFALMLKLLYLFKRRLYMEHLIVALHSHAFLCLALLLMFATMALQQWLAPLPGALHRMFNLVEAALWVWMPLYLLLMQKRVYAQGWWMTLLKYSALGICYITLLSLGAVFTVLFTVVYA